MPRLYFFLSIIHSTLLPPPIFVEPIRLTITAKEINGLPRQFLLIKANSRCSTLFHLLVPGGKCNTVIPIPRSSAKTCSSAFHKRTRYPLLPPLSAVINNSFALGYLILPTTDHHFLIVSTANSAVSAPTPTLTNPWFLNISYTP